MTRRARRAALAAVGAALLAGNAHGGPSIEGPYGGQPSTLRILAYNVRHGAGMDDVVDLTRAARVIRELQPDVVALLSKYPLSDVTNHRLPDGAEPRSALAARIRPGDPASDVVIVGIHLYSSAEERLAQAQRIVDILEDERAAVILVGDFNSTPDSPVISLLARTWTIPDKGTDHLTFPSHDPSREIDYIMYRPTDRFEVIALDVIDEPLASDHRPVLLELRWR